VSDSTSTRVLPELPSITRKPLAWVPMPLKASAITRALNALFAVPLQEGELEFLDQRTMNVIISDAGLEFSVIFSNGRLRADGPSAEADLTIAGTVYTFLLLATREEDADTLFFRRQLKTSGDTELGLYVKNFLDGLEPETLPYHKIIDPILRKSLLLADTVDEIRRRLPGLRPPFA
jgi:predicted lipid carrier protein YhbT